MTSTTCDVVFKVANAHVWPTERISKYATKDDMTARFKYASNTHGKGRCRHRNGRGGSGSFVFFHDCLEYEERSKEAKRAGHPRLGKKFVEHD